jgi:alkylhydroperoxidase family enzyme
MSQQASNAVQPLLQPTPPTGEEARVQDVLDAVELHLGFVPDALRLYGISPPLLESFVGGVSYFRNGTALSPVLTSMIRYLTSSAADCRFCIDLNESLLTHMGLDLGQIRTTRQDLDAAPIEERERSLLRLAMKSNQDPHGVSSEDLEAARAEGFSDRDIFDAVVQAANNRALTQVLRTFKVEAQGAFA